MLYLNIDYKIKNHVCFVDYVVVNVFKDKKL